MGGLMAAVIGATAKVMTKAATTAPAKPRVRTATKPAKAVRAASAGAVVSAKAANFASGTYGCAFGSRDYRIYVPATIDKLVPLLVMLHGYGQTPDDFAKGTRMNALAEEMGFVVLYPAQSRDTHPNRCWNWFREGDQGRDAGEPAILAGMVRMILAQQPIDPARVYVAGLSAGASAAMTLAQTHPDLFAAVGCHSGLPKGSARDNASALMAMKQGNSGIRLAHAMPTIIFHGDADRVVTPRNGRLIALRALETYARLHVTEQTRKVAQGRTYVRTCHRVGQGRGRSLVEHWLIKGSGHAWSGGSRTGRFVDPSGPNASREMLRFFLRHKTTASRRKAV